MSDSIHVLIIEDDFRIAAIQQQFVEKVEGYVVTNCVKTAQEALEFLQRHDGQVDLILLDLFIPDVEGLELFWRLRTLYHDVDIVVVTAATETKSIKEILRGGIVDYIIKPVDFKRFEQMLTRYKQRRNFLASREMLYQDDMDMLLGVENLVVPTNRSNGKLPKGIDPITLNEITDLLKKQTTDGITAVELSKQIGTSRSTARRYLEYLVAIKRARPALLYGNVGRPERQYILVTET
ncbi:response regulator [Lentibacillus songyuanensis]|uniref:response regulator n=1 Tax=Lentibacillus songyuanensis TaxID=3136161 RepID=UPI0031BA1666